MILKKINLVLLIMAIAIINTGCGKKYHLGYEKDYRFVEMDSNISVQLPSDFVNRYKSYWEAMSQSDLKTTFYFELPYEQYLKPMEEYISFKKTAKANYKVKAIFIKEISEDIIIITNEFNYGFSKTKQNDKWININGIWYHYYYPNLLPPL